jgi:hypothetical protein
VATTKKSTEGGGKSPSAKSNAKKNAADGSEPIDPRQPVVLTPKSFEAAVAGIEAIAATLEPPAEPVQGDLVDALIHYELSQGVPCGLGQEALRRIADEFVDRNEFRITEAYEVELLLEDLGIPDLFERCRTIQQAVNQIYGDQNKVSLDHLREAAVSERKSFFQRIPAISTGAGRFLADVLAWEEIAFSPRSTQRVQQRVGLEPKGPAEEAVVDRLRAALARFGHIPLRVGPDRKDGRPLLEPPLSPAWLLSRLAPDGKK